MVSSNRRLSRGALLLAPASMALMVFAPATTALAQASASAAAETEVGEVMVTARKREERLRDVPVAASVIDLQSIAEKGGFSDMKSLFDGVPGLRYFDTSTPANSEVSIRGAGTSRGTAAEAPVGLYRNGAYVGGGGNLGGRTFVRADLFDVGRIEVLRGTQGALYGRNAVGGAINLISAQPRDVFEGYVEYKYGINNEKHQAEAVVNVPLSDSVAVRLGVQGTQTNKGFFYNAHNDEYHDDEDGTIIRGQIRYHNEKLSVNFLAENQIYRIPGLYWQTYILPDPARTASPRGIINEKYRTLWDTPPLAKQNLSTFNLQISYDLGFATLESSSNRRRRESMSVFDGDAGSAASLAAERARGNPLPTTDPGNGTVNQNLARINFQDLHLTSNGEGPMNWLVGAEYLEILSENLSLNYRTPTAANRSIGNRTPTTAKIHSRAIYGSIGYEISERFDVELEGRYSKDKREVATDRLDRGTGVPLPGRLIRNAESRPDSAIFNIIAGYKPTEGWLTYAKLGTGTRAGGFNTNDGDPRGTPIPPAFDDEKSTTIEIGAKGNLAPNIYVTGAAYFTEIRDFLVQRDNGCSATNLACPVGSTSFLTNAGKAEVVGLEAEAIARYTVADGQLRITAAVGRQEGKVKSGPFAGRKTPQTPEWNGSLAVNYRRELAAGLTGFANLTYNFETGGVQEIEQTPQLYDRGIYGARIGVDRGPWQAALVVTNAANESYIIFENETVRRWNQPRVYTVQLRYKW